MLSYIAVTRFLSSMLDFQEYTTKANPENITKQLLWARQPRRNQTLAASLDTSIQNSLKLHTIYTYKKKANK